jgi:hypothetical protein
MVESAHLVNCVDTISGRNGFALCIFTCVSDYLVLYLYDCTGSIHSHSYYHELLFSNFSYTCVEIILMTYNKYIYRGYHASFITKQT